MARKKKNEAWGENGFEDWGGYMNAKKAKLEEQFMSEASKECKEASNLFNGIAIFVNGYTDPTSDELRRLMMAHGGVYHHYMRPRITTHIIASNLPYSKIVLYRKSQNPLPICKPQWITDSIKAGRILNFQNYLLYSSCTETQPQLKYSLKNKNSAPSTDVEINDKETKVKSPDPVNVASTSKNVRSTKDSEFLSEFYSHSRLHHISTMGATFKDYVNELRDKSNGTFPGFEKLKELKELKSIEPLSDLESSFDEKVLDLQEDKAEISKEPVIMHIDMDCFFVSVGLRNKPELKGLPVAVTHAKGNKPQASESNEDMESEDSEEHGSLSEIASCSYEARKAGIKNGMFLGEALKKCPNLKTIPYDFEGYKEVSYTLYNTVASYTLDIEAVSCDEMYADCTKILQESCLTPMEFATIIRGEIREKTGCPVSTGFGSNKLVARLATKKAKPDGQFLVKKEHITSYMSNFNVRDLPGVGWTTANKLNGINVNTCTELQAISLAVLQKEFGKKTGEFLYNTCRGIDNSKLSLEHVRKSVSAEVNYGIRFENNDDAVDFLKQLSIEVCSRLKKANAKGRCITLKLMVRAKEAPKETAKFMGHGLCYHMTRSKNLISAINDVDIITKEVIALWTQLQQKPEDARGIGIQLSRLETLKSKSRDADLMNFINKNKSGAGIHESEFNNRNEVQLVPISKVPEKSSSSKDLRTFFSSKLPDSDVNKEDYLAKQSTSRDDQSASNDKIISDSERNTEIYQSLSQVDESVLKELPDDIKNEIASAKNLSKKNVQTNQETFFKHTKSNSGRSTKVELPSIQDIDMAVLIELPEDIRNEILNEYSSKKRENQQNVETNKIPTKSNFASPVNIDNEVSPDEQHISFSQVDPEFLAALSEDLRRDVQMYCANKRTGQRPEIRPAEEAAHNSGLAKGTNIPRQNKTVGRPPKMKNNSKGTKNTACKNNKKKGILAAFKTAERKVDSIKVVPCANTINVPINKPTPEEAETILSHNRTISDANQSSNQNQEMLIDLVNHLFNLPLEQVKMQIQTWITNSKVINEIDFLSLATFLSMLPEKKRIEDLHVLLKTMHRCMTKTGNCIWHRAYRKTVKHVQHYMQIEYNSNLMVPPIRCNLLQCNTDVM